MNTVLAASTISELLCERATQSARAAACFRRRDADGWVSTTWSDLWDRVRKVSGAFQEMGLGKGDRLAIFARTCPQWQVAEMAALHSGGVVVGIDPHASVEHVEYVLRHSGACGLIVEDGDKARIIPEAVRSKLLFVVTLDEKDELPERPNWHAWDVIGPSDTAADGLSLPNVDADDPAVLLYTSGTSGRPKAIEFTHRQLLVACGAICRAFPEIDASDRVLCWLPMAHLFQRMMNLVAVAQGAGTYFVEDPREVMNCVREVQPAVLVAVPRFYEKLHEGIWRELSNAPRSVKRVMETALHTGIARARCERAGQRPPLWLRLRHRILDALVLRRLRAMMGRRIKFMITGSAPTPPWLLEFFEGIGLLVLEAYGLSENAVPMASNRLRSCRFGSVGKPFPENEIRFCCDGEIEVRSRTPAERPAEHSPPQTIFASGRIEGATPEIELRPRLSGRIVEILVEEGQRVRKGDVLLRLDDQQYKHAVSLAAAELALAEAQLKRLLNGARSQQRSEAKALYEAKLAELERAELSWERIGNLREAKAVSQQEADDQRTLVAAFRAAAAAAKARVELIEAPAREDEVQMDEARIEAAKAQLELAKVELERTNLCAPSAGEVLKINLESGELTGPGSAEPAVVMADTSRYHVRAFVEELDAPRVRVGMTARIAADGLPDKELKGHVIRLSPRMSRKELYSDQANERYDTKTRELWFQLEQVEGLVVGLRVDVMIDPDSLAAGSTRSVESEGFVPSGEPPLDPHPLAQATSIGP